MATKADFGLSPQWFSERRDLVAPPASGLLPGVEGLLIGVVTKLDGDPEGENKIQVKVPVLQAEPQGGGHGWPSFTPRRDSVPYLFRKLVTR
jgi:hypothetical protein